MVDALALKACRRAHPIRFGVVEREADRQAVSRLRELVLVERSRGHSIEVTASLEGEIDGEGVVLLAGWAADRVVAASCLVLPRAERRLPTEAAFDVQVEPWDRVVDAGWFIVARQHSSPEHHVLAGLVARSWLEMRARGFNHCCAALSKGSMRLSHGLGLRPVSLGPARRWLGQERCPVIFDMVGAAPHLFERWATPPSFA